MTFADFKALVLMNLGPDASRSGEGLDDLRNQAIINAMVDLQRFIIVLRLFNSFTKHVTDVTPVGRACTGTLPSGAKPREWWIGSRGVGESIIITNPGRVDSPEDGEYKSVSASLWTKDTDYSIALEAGSYNLKFGATVLYTMSATGILSPLEGVWTVGTGALPVPDMISADRPSRYMLEEYDWQARDKLVSGLVPDSRYYYSVGPDRRSFIVHPCLTTATFLQVYYDGMATSWADGDTLNDNWQPQTAEAVAEYVSARIVRKYDKDDLKRAATHEQSYITKRKLLFLDQKD